MHIVNNPTQFSKMKYTSKTGIHKAITLAVITLLAVCGCKSRQSVILPKEKSIVIVFENDAHCGIEGYARMAGLRDAVADTAWVAMVSSGDYLQGGTAGAISNGQYIADIMRVMGYDAVTLGNHEFDFGVPRMLELLRSAQLPVTCANLYDVNTGNRMFPSYVMKTIGTKKIAFVGATTTSTLYTESYAFFDKAGKQHYDLSEKDIYSRVQRAVDDARHEGADYVIVIGHLGEVPNTYNCDSHGLIASTRGIDALLDGHTHSIVECDRVANLDGKLIPVSETGTKFENVGKLVISPSGSISTHLVPAKELTRENALVRHVTDSINSLMAELVNRPVCHNDYDLNILDADGRQQVRYAETNSGDIVCDAFLSTCDADVALTNGGGIRSELSPGEKTYGDIVAMLPYDNNLCVVEVTGAQLLDLLDTCCQLSPVEDGSFPQVSGISFTLYPGNKPCVLDLRVLDKKSGKYLPVDLSRTYTIVTTDFCISGGGFYNKLRGAKVVKEGICKYNDALVNFITKELGGRIPERYAKPQGRILLRRK